MGAGERSAGAGAGAFATGTTVAGGGAGGFAGAGGTGAPCAGVPAGSFAAVREGRAALAAAAARSSTDGGGTFSGSSRRGAIGTGARSRFDGGPFQVAWRSRSGTAGAAARRARFGRFRPLVSRGSSTARPATRASISTAISATTAAAGPPEESDSFLRTGSTTSPGVVVAPGGAGVVEGPDAAGALEPPDAAGEASSPGWPRTGDRAAALAFADGGPFSAGRGTVGSSGTLPSFWSGFACCDATACVAAPDVSGFSGYWRQSLWSLGGSPPPACAAAAALGTRAADTASPRAAARSERGVIMDPLENPRRRVRRVG